VRAFFQVPRPSGTRCSPASVRRTTAVGPSLPKTSETASIFWSLAAKVYVRPETLAASGAGLRSGTTGRERAASLWPSLVRAASSAGSDPACMAGSRTSQARLMTPAMSRVPLVMASTTSCSGITMQNWPKAPSPR
jgi:hypothetical protein